MAAELLDIEAKLDTSQVQGQLQQLSKTSGLQNLDRAIRTLENSMKKLSAAMDKQATQAAAGGGAEAHLLGRNGLLLGRTPLARTLGATYAGKMLDQASGTLTKATGNWRVGAIADTMGSALKGAWLGPVGMAMGAIQGATDSVSKHFAELAEISNKLIEAKMKEWEATDKAFAVMQKEAEVFRMQAMSRVMKPEERQREIERLQGEHSTAKSNYMAAVKRAEEMEGPMYDAAVASATYWRDAMKSIEANIAVLEKDNASYVKQLQKQMRETKKAADEEERLAKKREGLRNTYSDQLRGFQHGQWLERHSEGQETVSDLRGNIFVTQANLKKAQKDYEKTLKEAASSDAPEDFQNKLKDMATGIKELEDALVLWKKRLEDKLDIQLNFNPFGALGNLNAVERAGYINANGQNAIPNLVEQILTFVRQITANTRPQNPTTANFNS